MHREISHTDPTFEPESPLPLYLLPALLEPLARRLGRRSAVDARRGIL